MATNLGQLVVSLGLDAANYIRGLVTAENATKKFGKSANSTFQDLAKLVGSLAIGTELVLATKGAITSAAALNDLSDATGSTVESLSKLTNQAAIAGTDFETLQTALLKLSVNMAGADEESSKVQATLKALGISTKDPVEAFNQIVSSLSKYKDGINKAEIATTLLSKAGPKLLATFKDIAELGDVQATVTKKQAEEAENLEKAWRRLAVESRGFANAILDNMVPPLLRLITVFNDAKKAGASFFEALRIAAQVGPIEDTNVAITRLEKNLASLQETAKDPGFELFGMKFAQGASVNILANIETTKKALESLRKQQLAAFGGPPTNEQAVKPEAPAIAKPDTQAAKKALEGQLKDIENFIKKEQDALQDREKLLQDLYQDDLIGLRQYFAERSAVLGESAQKQVEALDKQAAILEAAAKRGKQSDRIDAENKLADVIAKRGRLEQDVAAKNADLLRDEARAYKTLQDSVEQANIALAEMRGDTVTAALAGFDFASRKIKAQLDALAKSSNPEDQSLAAIGLRDNAATRELVGLRASLNKETEKYSRTIDELGIAQQRIQNQEALGAISAEEAFAKRQEVTAAYVEKLKEELVIIEKIAAKTQNEDDILAAAKKRLEIENITTQALLEQGKALQDLRNMLADSFANSFEDFIMGTKSARQAFKDFANDIERYLLKISLQKIGDQLFGGQTSGGGDVFGSLFKLFGMFGGGSGIQTVNGFQGFGTFASGTPFAPGGMAVVGEHGPELVDMPRGARVWPSGTGPQSSGDSIHMENHFHVQGTINSQTVRQIERGIGDSVARNRIDR